jgi:1-acyl-sn-glycerol-3-phosphate acyltransferase
MQRYRLVFRHEFAKIVKLFFPLLWCIFDVAMFIYSTIKRFIQILYSLYAFILFFGVVVAVLFPCLILCLPLGRIKGGNIMFDLYRFFGRLWYVLLGIRHTNHYESTPDPNGQYIFIANHISYLDAVDIILTLKHDFRAIGKHELLKVPIFGFLYRFCVVTVNRSSAEDRARSLADLRKMLAKGISIMVFPEGTFNMADGPLATFYDGAFKLAVETGKSIQPILLLDTFDRLHYRHVFTLTPGRSRAVYLKPIHPSDHPDADHKALKEIAIKRMSDKLIEYRASWINPNYFHQPR